MDLHSQDNSGFIDYPLLHLCFDDPRSAPLFAISVNNDALHVTMSGQEIHVYETREKKFAEPLAALLVFFLSSSPTHCVRMELPTTRMEIIAYARALPLFRQYSGEA
jgi:hypothetical protein